MTEVTSVLGSNIKLQENNSKMTCIIGSSDV